MGPDQAAGEANPLTARPRFHPAALVAVAVLATACSGDRGGDAGSTFVPLLRFDRERVILRVVPDSVEVEGVYEFLCAKGGLDSLAVFYPYPRDSLLGGARTLILDGRCGDEDARPLSFAERGAAGAGWTVPLTLCERLTVHTVYRQARLADYARYIVTTTAQWHRPLARAVFEVHLPEGAVPTDFSFPFERDPKLGPNAWRYEARDFMPDRDITVRWTGP